MTRKKDKKLSKVFSAVLHPGEKLLWTGQPDVETGAGLGAGTSSNAVSSSALRMAGKMRA